MKQVFDLQETFESKLNERIERRQREEQEGISQRFNLSAVLDQNLVIKIHNIMWITRQLITTFFIVAIAAVLVPLYLILTGIDSFSLGISFGLVIDSFVLLFLAFDSQTQAIEVMRCLWMPKGVIEQIDELSRRRFIR